MASSASDTEDEFIEMKIDKGSKDTNVSPPFNSKAVRSFKVCFFESWNAKSDYGCMIECMINSLLELGKYIYFKLTFLRNAILKNDVLRFSVLFNPLYVLQMFL